MPHRNRLAIELRTITRAVYAMLGVVYLVVGAGSMALPAGWISPRWAGDDAAELYRAAAPDAYLNHLTQEFGTLAIAVGLVFLWQARRKMPHRSLHWLLTLYLVVDSAIHWVGPQGFIGSLRRGLVNFGPCTAAANFGFSVAQRHRQACASPSPPMSEGGQR
jgi:hypothetical protein